MVWLSTAPFQPLTHWYQIRCLLSRPFFARAGQELTGTVQLTANERSIPTQDTHTHIHTHIHTHTHTHTHICRQSYDVDIDITLVGEGIKLTGSYDLKNPNFRYMTLPPPPPGSHQVNPTETYFEPSSNLYHQGTAQQQTAVVPQPQQIVSPVSAGGTVVVSAMTPHPVMAVHAAPPGVNGVTVMNGGLLSPNHNSTKPTNSIQAVRGVPTHAQPLLQSPPPGHTHLQSHSLPRSPHGGMFQPVGGANHQTQYVYATAAGTGGTPNFVYKFHQVHPGMGAGQGGRTHSTY